MPITRRATRVVSSFYVDLLAEMLASNLLSTITSTYRLNILGPRDIAINEYSD